MWLKGIGVFLQTLEFLSNVINVVKVARAVTLSILCFALAADGQTS